MPPWIKTIVMPTARIATNTDWFRTLKMLFAVRNVEFCVAITAHITSRNTKVPPPALVPIRRGSRRACSSSVGWDMSDALSARNDGHVANRRRRGRELVAQAGERELAHRAVEHHRADDAHADHDLVPRRVDLLDLQPDVDGPEEQRAERRPGRAAAPTRQARPGQHGRRDGLQLEALP